MLKQLFGFAHRELTRVVLLVFIGLVFIVLSPYAAIETSIPALSPWGLFLGGSFIIAALSHIMRRALFPQLDLQSIAKKAMTDSAVGAGLVFLGVCLVLAAFIFVNGSMLRL